MKSGAEYLVDASLAMRAVCKAIARIAPHPIAVLIRGESGTGKELIGRAIHRNSQQAEWPFIVFGCGAIPGELLADELFGHEKGAFIGADSSRIGIIERCAGGTLYLNEIAEMPLLVQARLYEMLERNCFQRLGGDKVIRSTVRVVASTSRDLERLVTEGKFRADLYHHLKQCVLKMPPLRERRDDVPLLATHFMQEANAEYGTMAMDISPEALELLVRHSWPGNARELRSVMRFAVRECDSARVVVASFPPEFRNSLVPVPVPPSDDGAMLPGLRRFVLDRIQAGSVNLYDEVRMAIDREVVQLVLDSARGNLSRAARTLGLSRPTLRGKMECLNISSQAAVALEEEPVGGHSR